MNEQMNMVEAALELTKIIGKEDPHAKIELSKDAKAYYTRLYADCYKTISDAVNAN